MWTYVRPGWGPMRPACHRDRITPITLDTRCLKPVARDLKRVPLRPILVAGTVTNMPVNGIDHSSEKLNANGTRRMPDSRRRAAPNHVDDSHGTVAPAGDHGDVAEAAPSVVGHDVREECEPDSAGPTRGSVEMSGERIRAVLSRVDQRFYQTSPILDEIIERILPDLHS